MNDFESKIDFITNMVKLYKNNALDDFEISIKDTKNSSISLRFSNGKLTQPSLEQIQQPSASASKLVNPTVTLIEPLETNVKDTKGMVYSEMVGTAYLSASPDEENPFVKVGQLVSEGETILIIEAMKTMNHIEAPHSGTVEKILVSDGEPVQYNSELMIIR